MSKIFHMAEIAKGVGDPQCYKGKVAHDPKFKAGDHVVIKELPDVFYSQTPTYARGTPAVVNAIVYESPAPEDEAWGHLDSPEWFYSVIFKQKDLWDDYPKKYANDTLSAEMSERWLEPA